MMSLILVRLGLESPFLLHTLGSIYMDMGDSDAAAFYLRSALRISGATQRTGVPNRGMGSSITSEDVQLANTFTQLGR